MEVLYLFVFLLICGHALSQEELPTSAAEISQINNLFNDKTEFRLDPELRRALLRVLNKMEEEEKKKLFEDLASENQNLVTEEDFIKFFSKQDIPKEIYQNEDANYQENTSTSDSKDEILSYSHGDSTGSDEVATASVMFDEQTSVKPDSEINPPTQPTPQENAIYFQIPEPIQVPDPIEEQGIGVRKNETLNVQETRSIQGPTINTFTEESKSNSKEEIESNQKVSPTLESSVTEDEKENLHNSTKAEKHSVEFFTAPLLAAFTVQQDEKGVPRRVIPLNYQRPGPILLPNHKEIIKEEQKKQFELEEKQRALENHFKFLQEQQLRQQEYLRLQEFARETKRLQEEEARRQLLLEQQRQQEERRTQLLLEQQRLEDERRRQLLLEQQRVLEIEQKLVQARQRQQQLLNQRPEFFHQERPRIFQNQNIELENVKKQQQQIFQEHFKPEFLSNERPNFVEQERFQKQQSIDFQKSVDFQFRPPAINNNFQSFSEHNRVNRREPSNFIGNFGINQPQTVDSQLQNLLYQSGIANNFKGKTEVQEDLNIVSKVLSLNHGSHLQHFLPRLQFQESNKVFSVVSPPSTVIQPPKQ